MLERVYTACLDVVLLILPLVVMTTTYGLISYKLWPRGGAIDGGAGTRSHRHSDVANGQSVRYSYPGLPRLLDDQAYSQGQPFFYMEFACCVNVYMVSVHTSGK